MNIRGIDQELTALTDQLRELNAQARHSSSEKFDRIAGEHQIVRTLEAELMSKIRLLQQNSQKASLLGQQEAAILLYCARLATHLKHYLSLASSAFSKITWLKILQKRANSSQNPGQYVSEIQEEQLLSVFTRQQELEQAKSYWIQRTSDQEAMKKELETRFAHLQIVRENRLAGNSLQLRLGQDLQDAFASPLLKILKDLLRGYILPIAGPQEFKHMQASLGEYQKTALAYLEFSRSEAMESLNQSAHDSQRHKSTPFIESLNSHLKRPFDLPINLTKQAIQDRLALSKDRYQQRQKELESLNFPNLTLKLMHNKKKNDTTSDLNSMP